MTYVLDLAPLAAAVFAVPQFVPQLGRASSSGDVDGVSWSWAALTSGGNAAWTVYFAWSGYWFALVPSVSASSMAAMLAVSIARSNAPGRRSVVLVTGWVLVLTASLLAGGRVGLGTVLSTAFVVQVAPAVWTAYRTQAPTGIATGTWLLVLGELTCWGIYGLHQGDRRLAVMGVTGVLAAGLMILRATTAGRTHLATAASVPRVVERAAAGDARW